jgi:hypothetical protein
LELNQGLIQYIGTNSVAYFNNLQVVGRATLDIASEKQLQLKSFAVKPLLEKTREEQQSNPPEETPIPEGPTPTEDVPYHSPPRCKDGATRACNYIQNKNYSNEQEAKEKGDASFVNCRAGLQENDTTPIVGECSDSPLYLYGKKGLDVKVSVNTSVYNSNAPYSSGYKGTLTGNGKIKIGQSIYESLEYDYDVAIRKLLAPSYGKTVEVSKVSEAVNEYGQKLGLTKKEISDTAEKAKAELKSKYVFVSFYDDETSKAILPITFDPKPDVYRNIVFYFKQTDKQAFHAVPVFEKYPSRTGFTAVEVSYIIE